MREVEIPAFEDLQWLAAFARRLAWDADEADDLVQETLLTAWRHPPQARAGLRPWLATVLRNRLRMVRRGQARREARDATAPPPEAEDLAPDVAVARIRVLSRLTAELEQLAAQDQALIVRRFLHGQSAAEIARALSMPAGTVRSAISRVLARLRERLDERCDGRDAWCAAIVAVPHSTTANPLGANAMLKTTLFVTLAGTATAGAYVWAGRHDPQPVDRAATSDEGPQAAAAPESAPSASTPSESTAPESTAPESTPSDGAATPDGSARARWEKTRAAVQRSLREHPPTVPAPKQTDTRQAYARLVMACVRDIENQPAKFSLEITEIGAPDIGTIVAEAKVVGSTITNPEILQCAEQSMLAYQGPAPAVAYERTFRMGLQSAPSRSPEQLALRLQFYMDAHFKEVRACEPAGVNGHIDLDVTADETGKVTGVAIAQHTVDATTAQCIADAAASWTFPEPVTTATTRHRYVLPVHDLKFAE